MNKINDKEIDEDNGKVPCPYCGKKFVRLNSHKCKSIPRSQNLCNIEDSSGGQSFKIIGNEDDGRVPCPYCFKKFKRLSSHNCSSKPLDEDRIVDSPLGQYPPVVENGDDGRIPCPYCQKRFKRLKSHKCPSKPLDKDQIVDLYAGQYPTVLENEDDGQVPCPYCQKRFKRLSSHKCPSKPLDKDQIMDLCAGQYPTVVENEDDGQVPCPYCQKRFKRLKSHKCPSKPLDKDQIVIKAQHQDLIEEVYVGKGTSGRQSSLTKEMEDEDDMRLISSSSLSKTYNESFKNHLKSIKLSQNYFESGNINVLMDRILLRLNKGSPLHWKKFNAGSYYSRVKVSKPDEFDFMIYPTIMKCRIEPSSSDPCFCHVFITNRQDLPYDIQKILDQYGELTPSKFKKHVFKVFEMIINDVPSRQLSRIENEKRSPAYTVSYQYKRTMDKGVEYGTDKYVGTDIDLVPCLQVPDQPEFCMQWKTKKLTKGEIKACNIYVVPKNFYADGREHDVWRISHSKFEKEIVLNNCNKDDRTLIRSLKSVLAKVKEDKSKLCSYHILNHCFHFFESTEEQPELREYILDAIDRLIRRLESRYLPHFFIPEHNLLEKVSIRECNRFIEKLKFYREKWSE